MIKLFRYLKPFALAVAGVFVLVFFQSLAELYLPTLMADIVDIGIIKGDIPYILKVGGLMLLIAGGSAFCAVLASYLSSRTAAGFGRNLRSRVFARVESYSLGEFDKIGTATLITRTTNDITQVQNVLMMMLGITVRAPMMAIGGIVMAVSKDATLSLLLVAVVPLVATVFSLIAMKGVPLFRAMQEKLDKLNLVVRENLTGIRVIRAFDRIDYEKQRFQEANSDLTSTAIRVNQIMALLMPVLMLVMNLTSIAIVWFGGIRIDGGHMQVGDMMAFLQYAMQIMFSLVMLSMMFVMIPRAQASAVRINEVLDTVPEINDPPEEKPAGSRRGCVEFRDVTFSYPGAEQPALSHISFQANPGQITAIIGGTGSGKSTLVSLIPRFYDVDSGRVLVDGVDVREMTQASLRAKIGFVPQQAVLFTGTIAGNIRYGKETATDEEVKRAAETAQAMEFITGMKGGFDAEISQGGTNLSGGQKQRLSIARALVRRPEVYVLDDSFSALDFKTDARLRAALRKEMAGTAVLIVAQRVSTVMDADQIIVLDNGRIAGIGKHQELLKTCAVYREIVSSQLSEEELA
ncbi:multidrug ABC transporter ATP-binding protein [Clostridiales bacterium PH28_bin88]|nr:multidrug ABC transporter ATP-binding protein [Clostridiales bacterium PH28_bin88]